MSLKKALEREFSIPIRIRAGVPGSFKVLLDNAEIYSKKNTGTFPNAPELIALIRSKAPSALSS